MISQLLGIRVFDLEASSACNLWCRFCPRELLPETGLMRQETFTKFLNAVRLRPTDMLVFSGIGEPLLNPSLSSFVQQAKERYPGVRCGITTNGALLDPTRTRALLDARIDTIAVSFNGIEPDAYERLHRGARFGHTLANVDAALDLIRTRSAPTQIQINYILTRENAATAGKIESFWRARGVTHFQIQRMHDRAGAVLVEGMTPPDTAGLRGNTCEIFQRVNFISWKGDILYCCHDVRREHKIANIRDKPWTAIDECKDRIRRGREWPKICTRCTDPLRTDLPAQLDAEIAAYVNQQHLGPRTQGTLIPRS
jgi:MoaA/NifB/PqqE/SkfB family radical SAM enzyme